MTKQLTSSWVHCNFKQLIMSIEETKQAIGQIEKSIDQASDVLDIESFSNYCDSAYTLIAYWRKIQQTLKEEQ